METKMTTEKLDFNPSFEGLEEMVTYLTGPKGCPWDQKQTPSSLTPMLLEECHELIEAIENNDIENIIEEIGDVIFHLAFQIQLANSKNLFDSRIIFRTVIDKYIRRHPHVFGGKEVENIPELKKNWEEIKKLEKEESRSSALDGIPKSLPSLSHAEAIQKRAANTGFDWETLPEIDEKVIEELDELKKAKSKKEQQEEFGDLIFTLVNIARHQGINAEQALRESNRKFLSRFTKMEVLSSNRGQEFEKLNIKEKDALWDEVKLLD